MNESEISSVLREIAAIRVVLVHLLARLNYEDLKSISEDISQDFGEPPTELAAYPENENDHEAWAAPYRRAMDGILAQAETLRGRRGSRGKTLPQKDL
jgi:hypothetical protein